MLTFDLMLALPEDGVEYDLYTNTSHNRLLNVMARQSDSLCLETIEKFWDQILTYDLELAIIVFVFKI